MAPPWLDRDSGGAEATSALLAGGAPGDEDEVGLQRGPRGEPRPLVEDEQAAIEQFAEFDAAAGVGAAAGPRGDLEPARPEATRS